MMGDFGPGSGYEELSTHLRELGERFKGTTRAAGGDPGRAEHRARLRGVFVSSHVFGG
jgi:hypothetical protein